MGGTSKVGTAYPSGAAKVTPIFSGGDSRHDMT
jgi:hypothetical protein